MQDVAQRPHSCAACGGPVNRGPAENLWFYSASAPTRKKICDALDTAGADPADQGRFIKVPVGRPAEPGVGTAMPLLAAVADALSLAECAAVKVAWIVAGNDPYEAVIEAPTLAALQSEMEHHWFAQLLDDGSIYMHFQPIVSLHRPEVLAYEALVRAHHGGRELMGAEVVATALQTKLLVPLDARTRIKAIEQFSASGSESKLFVNFQPTTIYNPRYCLQTTFAALERSNLRIQDVVFEVVESEDVEDLRHLQTVLDMYRAHGLGVALDDFGIGYSTEERLQRLQPDYLKIDRSLCQAATIDGASAERIAGIVALAAAQGCAVIAEGIETAEQWATLRTLGVTLGQGYLFGRPALLPAVTWPA